MIRVTILDTETGDGETTEIGDDYLVICAGTRYVHGVQVHGNGTHVVTVKADPSLAAPAPESGTEQA